MFAKHCCSLRASSRVASVPSVSLVSGAKCHSGLAKTLKTDVAIVGGGIMGTSTAFWLKYYNPSLSVTVIERDMKYQLASTVLSAGGLRQQFSLAENIKLSRFSYDFVSNVNQYLNVPDQDPVDVCFKEKGYLFLAGDEESAERLQENQVLQNSLGASIELLGPDKIKEKFPWMTTEDIVLGAFGTKFEGWLDPHCLLTAIRKKAQHLGVNYVEGEVSGFTLRKGIVPVELCNELTVNLSTSSSLQVQFDKAVIAAGPRSGKLSQLLKLGTSTGDVRSVGCPVEPRKRTIFVFKCGENLNNVPMVIDQTYGFYFRPEGPGYIVGAKVPLKDHPSDMTDTTVDYEEFHRDNWPYLAKRVQAFENLKVTGGWCGFYEYNTLDQNGIAGPHPYYPNIFWATGFSGHGFQKGVGVGRGVAELILHDSFQTIDLSILGWDRIILNIPVLEQNPGSFPRKGDAAEIGVEQV